MKRPILTFCALGLGVTLAASITARLDAADAAQTRTFDAPAGVVETQLN